MMGYQSGFKFTQVLGTKKQIRVGRPAIRTAQFARDYRAAWI
jgi:hypothetical protein